VGLRNKFRKKSDKADLANRLMADADALVARLTAQTEEDIESFRQVRLQADKLKKEDSLPAPMMQNLRQIMEAATEAIDTIQHETSQVCNVIRQVTRAGSKLAAAGQHFDINNASVFLSVTLSEKIKPISALHDRHRLMLKDMEAELERIAYVSDPHLHRDLPAPKRLPGPKSK
jgi:hypothetical protein